jgi:D-sedoheptulose 7-phosphate isomerase
MPDLIKDDFLEAQSVLATFITNEENFVSMKHAGMLLVETIEAGKKIICCGNGGSMSDAMHFAEELSGRFRDERPSLPAIAVSDPAHITCAANDYGFESIFSRFVEGLGQEEDVLFAISTSGNSKNIIKAAEVARSKSMRVISLTGKSGGELAKLSDIEIRAPHSTYSDRTQEIHIKIIHALIHFVEDNLNHE